MNEKKILLIRYLRATLIPLTIAICLSVSLYLYGLKADDTSTALIDAFQVSGFMLILFASFFLIGKFGAFDMIIFGVSRLFARLLPWRNIDTSQTYFEYVNAKKEKRKGQMILWPTYIIGAIFLLIGFLFY